MWFCQGVNIVNTMSSVIAPGELMGKWGAESFDGKSLEAVFLDSACVEFGADGRCWVEVRLSEAYGGAPFPWSSGGWNIIGGRLEYRPDEGGEIWSAVGTDAERAELTLSPDPFIALEGGTVHMGSVAGIAYAAIIRPSAQSAHSENHTLETR
jgi:hypothetical protein